MTQMKMLITAGGKHPAHKWAELAADEIVDISEQAPETRIREAREFRTRLVDSLVHHHQMMMNHEQIEIRAGRHDLALPYETEAYAMQVRDEICGPLVEGTTFADHFKEDHVREWVEGICNKYFKSAKMVERQHFHSENAKPEPVINNKKKK
jgi:hypothetical protein